MQDQSSPVQTKDAEQDHMKLHGTRHLWSGSGFTGKLTWWSSDSSWS